MATPTCIELLRRTIPADLGRARRCDARRSLRLRLRFSLLARPTSARAPAPRDAQRKRVAPSDVPLVEHALRLALAARDGLRRDEVDLHPDPDDVVDRVAELLPERLEGADRRSEERR